MVDNTTPESFHRRVQRQQEQLWEDLDHRLFSGIHVMRELRRLQGVGPKALMPVVFTSLLNLDDGGEGTKWLSRLGEPGFAHTQTPQVYLDFIVQEDKGTLILNWDAVDELFPQDLLNDMFQSFQRLLLELASDDAAWDRNLADNTRQLLPPEQWEIRRQANATEAPLSDELLHTPFLRQVAERPQDLAICAPQRRLTYLETYQRACRIERELLDRGVGPNQMVGVLMAKGWEQIVAVLGIHLAGGAYLPIDSELPPERQRYLIENGTVKIVLIQSELRSLVNVPEGIELLEVDAMEPLKSVPPVPRRRQTPEDLAYIIYTSGSTGQPKGVMIDHRGALNTVLDINQRFGVGPRDRVLALSRLNFDLSVYDIFGLLAVGGAIVIPSKELAQDPSHWTDLVAAEKVTIWNTVPALMQLMTEEMARQDGGGLGSTLRLIMMSGDWIPVNLPGQIQRALPEARIVSLGGATEASIWSILYPIDKVDPGWKSVPYGKPMLNQTFQVLNQALAPCPVWVPGNLYIGGIGIAKGYFGDAKKTNASFIQHPVTGERLYRTGDLGRYLPDGNIEFLGREDFQVKIQGYRIELGEIEVRLQEYPGVDNCAVIVREDGAGGKRLVGYVVPQEGAQLETGPVREYLRTKLPEYMIPSAIVYLDRFPLTANGKVDQKALPAPVREKKESGEEKSPSGDFLEARLIQLWEKVLGVQPVAADDNFFELGGTSIMAVRLFSELRKRFGKSLSLSTLFQAPTVEKIAELLRGSGYSSSWASLVPIQTKGDKPPFYCVHGAGGNVLMFRELAERMAAHGFPFYGLQARGLDGGQQYLKSVEEMATYYLKEIREFQPEGPYYLGGFCLGGQVAFEMAQTLRQQGEEVALLAVIDTYNFHGEKMVLSLGQSISHAGQKAAFHVQNILRLPVKQKVRYFLKKFQGFYIRESDRLILRLSNFFGIGQYKRTANSDGMLEYVNEEAHFAYVAAPYDGRTIIFKARKNYSYLHDPLLGWGEVITGPVEFIELPCNPGGLFMDPYVQSLADKLREEIDDSKIGYPSLESHLTFSRSGEKPEEPMGLVGAGSQASRGDYV
jgi:amino acid adenylation domain-containing protein